MRKFAFVILLFLPLMVFSQAEKRYRSIIIDSVKALNGGRVDVKDTLLLDSLAVYNSDLSSQYTSRSLVDSAFVGTAISSGGANTIYSADDNLAGNRIVTLGANTLTFSGNLTTFQGINATSLNFALLAEDNVGTDLFSIRNDGLITVPTGTNSILMSEFPGIPNFSGMSLGGSITANTFNFASFAGGDLHINTPSGESIFFKEGNTVQTTILPGGDWQFDKNILINRSSPLFSTPHIDIAVSSSVTTELTGTTDNISSNMQNTNITDGNFVLQSFVGSNGGGSRYGVQFTDQSESEADFVWFSLFGDPVTNIKELMRIDHLGNVGIGTVSASEKLQVDGNAIIDSSLSTTARTTTLGVAATTFPVFSNIMTMTGDGGGNTIATITGANSGMLLTLIFVDGNITITDDNSHASDSVDLSAAFTGADDTTLQIVYDGTSWYEISRSTN